MLLNVDCSCNNCRRFRLIGTKKLNNFVCLSHPLLLCQVPCTINLRGMKMQGEGLEGAAACLNFISSCSSPSILSLAAMFISN